MVFWADCVIDGAYKVSVLLIWLVKPTMIKADIQKQPFKKSQLKISPVNDTGLFLIKST